MSRPRNKSVGKIGAGAASALINKRPKASGGGKPKSTTPGLSKKQQDQIEQSYGLSYALFQAFPELNTLLGKAVKENWSAQKFQVELRQTDWFKTHSDVWRKNTALKYSDPASYNERLNQQTSQFENLATSLGVHLDPSMNRQLAEQALLFGWDEGQVKNVLSQYVAPSQTGDYGGDLASVEHNLNSLAYQNGIKLSPQQLQGWMQSIANGNASEEELSTQIRDIAAKTFSLYGDQIRGGANLMDIASPYVQAMASTLELNPNNLDLFDPNIRQALTGSLNDKTGQYEPMSVTKFEDSLRQDKRWQYTQTAQDQARGYVAALSNAWGLSA